MSRIDRFLVSPSWDDHFQHLSQQLLPSAGSNHLPILLCQERCEMGPRPFRFELMWLEAKGQKSRHGGIPSVSKGQ